MLDTVSGFQSNIIHPWTPEREALLRELWADLTLSGSQIAARLGGGATRSSVLGKVHRLGLAERPRTLNQYGPGKSSPKVAKAPPRPAPSVVSPKRAEATPQPPQPQIEAIVQSFAIAIPVSRRVTIEELRPFMCRFMLGDATLGIYCGSSTSGGSWCPDHKRLVFAGTPTPNNAAPVRASTGLRVFESEAA